MSNRKAYPKQTRVWLQVHLGHVMFVAVLYAVYNSRLYSADLYAPWRAIFGPVVFGIAILGWIPVRRAILNGATLRRFPYFLMLGLLVRRLPGRKCKPRRGTYWRHPTIRRQWLLIIIKSYFLPLSVGGLWYGIARIQWLLDYPLSLGIVLLLVRGAALLVSAAVGAVGYSIESKRWGYPFRAIDTSVASWIFCLACYPPASEFPGMFLAGNFFPENRLFASDSPIAMACSILATALLLINVWAVAALGRRYANLSYRGIVTNGPFAAVRHPQYAAKLGSWFFEWLPFFAAPLNVVFFCGWCGLYVGRTITEERFLRRFGDYTAYCGRVKWRFLPFVW